MQAILHLLRFKSLVAFKTNTQIRPETIFKSVASALVFGGFTISAFYFANRVTTYLLDEAHLGLFLVHRFLSMVLYVFFLSVNVGNLIVAYAALYRSKETMFLLSKPLSHTHVFIIKFIDSFFSSSLTLFLMIMAVLAGYGAYFEASPAFYASTVILLIVPFMIISGSLAALLLMSLIFLARRIGVRMVFGIMIGGYLTALYAYFRISDPVQLAGQVLQLSRNGGQHLSLLDPPLLRFLPNHWVSEALFWTARGDLGMAAIYGGVLVVLAACVVAVLLLAARKYYYKSWLASLELRTASESRKTTHPLLSLTRESALEPQTAALVKKEFWQFFREPSQWIHLSIILLLTIVFVSSIVRLTLTAGQPFLQTVLYFVIYGFAAFLIASVALRFVFPMIGSEGEGFWVVRSAPVRLSKVYWLKFSLVFIPIALVSQALGYAAHQSLGYYGLLYDVTIVSLFLIGLVLISLNLGLGSLFADFRETNPIKASSTQGATMTFLICIVYLVMVVAALFFPITHYFEAMLRGKPLQVEYMYTGVAIVVVLSVFITLAASMIGLRALRRER